METPFMAEIPHTDLIRLAEQSNQGGEYEAARGLIQRELARRAKIIEAMHTVDDAYLVPQDPADLNICESCE